MRTTISDSRVAARANISSATLPLTSSTSSAMTTFIEREQRRVLPDCSMSDEGRRLDVGDEMTRASPASPPRACALSTASSAFACSGVTPGFIRAQIVDRPCPRAASPRFRRSSAVARLRRSTGTGTPPASRPTTAVGTSLTSTVLPRRPGSARESLAPDPLANHDDRRRRRARVGIRQRSSEDRRDARHRERRRGHFGDRDGLDECRRPCGRLRAMPRPAATSVSVPVPPRQRRKSATTRDSGWLAARS